LTGPVTKASKVVALEGLGSHDSALFVGHRDSELFTVPGINGVDFTCESNSVGTGVLVSHVKDSPEGVTLSTLVVASIILVTFAGFL
jgi:hypothetical protein